MSAYMPVAKRTVEGKNVYMENASDPAPFEMQIDEVRPTCAYAAVIQMHHYACPCESAQTSLIGVYDRYKEAHKHKCIPEHICKSEPYFKKALHRARVYLGIAFVKTLGVTGDCSKCLEIDRLRKKKNRHVPLLHRM